MVLWSIAGPISVRSTMCPPATMAATSAATRPRLNRCSAVHDPPRRVATSTAPAIAMQASRENQNSSAIGSPPDPGVRAVGSTRSSPVQPAHHSTPVTTVSTSVTANAPASTLNSSRDWVRTTASWACRMLPGSAVSPASGTRKPKNSTQLVACGSSAMPEPTSSSVPPPTATSAVRASPARSGSPAVGNTVSARM